MGQHVNKRKFRYTGKQEVRYTIGGEEVVLVNGNVVELDSDNSTVTSLYKSGVLVHFVDPVEKSVIKKPSK